jgi:xanthine dehydrogenase YagT iron-sulfur-binding subunit
MIRRRDLVRGIPGAALVAGCRPRDATDGSVDPRDPGPGGGAQVEPTPLAFELNGRPVALDVEPRTTLADLLRFELDQTGTKVVCDRGACGACMVLVDGIPKNSCMLLAHDVAGSHVTTVEGLGGAASLSPLQRAFVEHDALQCGFCTPGMLISCQALLARTAGRVPAEDEIRASIAGNLCRCGTYPHVVAAVKAAARERGGA